MSWLSRFPQRLVGGGLLGAALLTTAAAKTPETPQYRITELQSDSQKFIGQKLIVSGTLQLASRDYFSAPQFVLTDETGNSIPVTAWAPLEVPPPSVPTTGKGPNTMRDFIGQRMSLTGNYALDVSSKASLLVAEFAMDSFAQKTSVPVNVSYDSATGTPPSRMLVLMVDFTDRPGQAAPSSFQDLIFGDHPANAPNGSVRDYYREISYGQWDVTGDVNRIGVAWLHLPQSSHYYSGDCYGVGGSGCAAPRYPQNPQKMVEDAIVAAKLAGIDFSRYDGNNDGVVDSLFILHAGPGSEFSASPGDIWSHRGAPRAWINTAASGAKPVWVAAYTTVPEYWKKPGDLTIGVVAHEYGHTLGLPDLYDMDGNSSGTGRWSLMSSGCWNGNLGDSPAHMDAWSKYTLGWVKPQLISGTLRNQPIVQAATAPDVYEFMGAAGNQPTDADFYGEYFLVENRERSGFDRGLPGSGLLVWHVDNSLQTNLSQWYPGCTNCTSHYRVALVQADGRWDLEHSRNLGDTGDPFPGACGSGTCGLSFTNVSDPTSALYSGASSGFGMSGISAPGPTMTATLSDLRSVISVNTDALGIHFPGTVSFTTSSDAVAAGTGYGLLQASTDSGTPAGLAIFGFHSNNVLLSEASVPASDLIQSGRIPVSIDANVNTGIAFANPGNDGAAISFFFTDAGGKDFGNGTLLLDPHTQIARFVTEAPFNAAAGPFKGTCTFQSSVPVGAVALRSLVNERSEFLMTTLTVAGINSGLSNGPTLLPHYADGGGWSTEVILVNPTDQVLTGTVQFAASDSAPAALKYSIAPRSQQLLDTPGTGDVVRAGSVWVTPGAGTNTPSVAAVLSMRLNGVTVSVAGVQAVVPGTAFRLYAEAIGNFGAAEAGTTQTGLAIANLSATAVTIHLQLTGLDGTAVVSSAQRVVPGLGHFSIFLSEIPEFSALPIPFQGLVRVWTDSNMNVSVIGFRARYNERRDFLISTLPPTNENDPQSSAERVFPQIVSGGGSTTEIILFSPAPQSASGVLHLYAQNGDAIAGNLP